MIVYVNNEEQYLEDQSKLIDLILRLDLSQRKGIALAVNQSIVPKSKWAEFILSEKDKVSIIEASQGG